MPILILFVFFDLYQWQIYEDLFYDIYLECFFILYELLLVGIYLKLNLYCFEKCSISDYFVYS